MGTVYGLQDPRTGEVRYVGVTRGDVSRRRRSHMRCRKGTRKDSWVRALLDDGVYPALCVLESNVPDEDLFRREREWVQRVRDAARSPLVNTSLNARIA